MSAEVWLTALIAAAAAFGLTRAVRKFALATGAIDIPGQRSSHATPTPRGGGLAVVAATHVTLVVFLLCGVLSSRLFIALFGGGLAVAWVGYRDDRQGVSPAIRLAVHFVAAIWALAWIGGLPPLQVGHRVFDMGWPGHVLGVLGVVWALNLFNFMDGLDGIAASEAAFISGAGAAIGLLGDGSHGVSAVALAFAGACCGFLVWNWPPAKIFMGDVGSGYIGYVIAILAIATATDNPVALFIWLILGGVFFVDATVTLVRRLARRERVYEAHRTHAYQWLARRWSSHERVTKAVVVVNLLWLLPWALAADRYPDRAGWIALIGLTPLLFTAVAIGAGRPETSPSHTKGQN